MPESFAALPFTFEVKWDGKAATLKGHGRLVAGVTNGLYEGLKPLLAVAERVVIDLEDVAYVDSMGIGVLARLYVASREAGCELRLAHLGKQVRSVLKLTNLLWVFGEVEGHGITVA